MASLESGAAGSRGSPDPPGTVDASPVTPSARTRGSSKPARLSLVLWAALLLAFAGVYGFFDANGRSARVTWETFWTANWRFGLSAPETLWDSQVFWGEWWFNLLLVVVMVAFWWWRAPPDRADLWGASPGATRRLCLGALAGAGGLMVAMALTAPPPATLWTNWFPTHGAYQLPVWPALLASMALLVAPMKKYATARPPASPSRDIAGFRASRRGPTPRSLVLWGVAALLWVVMLVPTLWHPHAFVSLENQVHTWLCTLAFPMGAFVFVATQCLRDPPRRHEGHAGREAALLVGALGIFVALQLVGAYGGPAFASHDIFSMWLNWWWPAAHWPGWTFSVCVALAVVAGARLYYLRRATPSRTAPAVKRPAIEAPAPRVPNAPGAPRVPNAPGAPRVPDAPARGLLARRVVVASCLAVLVLVPVVGIARYDADPARVLVNQVGYLPGAPKRVVFQAPKGVVLPDAPATFHVYRAEPSDGPPTPGSSPAPVLNGSLVPAGSFYQHAYLTGNFTALAAPGTYHVTATVAGTTYRSPAFRVANGVYDRARERAVDFYYYQRCGYEVTEVVPGFPGHHACHLDDAMVWNGSTQVHYNLTGGWHDAGDYNKYHTWFYTQWFCVRALADAWERDPGGVFAGVPDKYDSTAPDVLDEALWGATFLVKSVDRRGLRPGTRGLVFRKVVDWNYADNTSALMSYSGPPARNTDNVPGTGDERVVWDRREHPSPWGFGSAEAGYGFAGALLQTARLLEAYHAAHPGYRPPPWAVNATVLRETAALLNQTYSSHDVGRHIYSRVTRLYYEQEAARVTHDSTGTRAAADALLALVDPASEAWIHSYALARLLDAHLELALPVPAALHAALARRQETVFADHYRGPFGVFHARDPTSGGYLLFVRPRFYGYHGIINCDRFAHAYLQAQLARFGTEAGELEAGGAPRLDLLQNELDYLFGVNPLGVCQMDGVGGQFVAQIHHRYAYARYPSGRVPGGIINGLMHVQPTREWARARGYAGDMNDRWQLLPEEAWVDAWPNDALAGDGVASDSNEIWIPHDAIFLEMMTAWGR